MAKDGTLRGGARPGTGPKPKALTDRIAEGKTAGAMVLPDPVRLDGEDIPAVKDYLKAKQKNGRTLRAEEIYNEVYEWLRERGCEKLVSRLLVEQYAMAVARWIQCEECISEFGSLAKHPTTGNAIASPYVSMSRDYKKQINTDWYQIYQIVRDNSTIEFSGSSPQDSLMEKLLQSRKG